MARPDLRGAAKNRNENTQAARHSLHQLRKRRLIGSKCCDPSPMEKITSGDLKGGWQRPAPDQGLESVLFFSAWLGPI